MPLIGLIPTDKQERLAVAAISGLIGAHNAGRLDQARALAEIADALRTWKVRTERVTDVLSANLRHWTEDDRYYAAQVRALLLAAGADLDLAIQMRQESPQSSAPRPA